MFQQSPVPYLQLVSVFYDLARRYWSKTNPHWVDSRRGISGQNLMVWIGVIDTNIVGPYFFEGGVNSRSFLNMLHQFVLPELRRLGQNSNDIIYMHDGAPPHITQEVRDFLSDTFFGWIGRGNGSIMEWPPRSPDFNPLDFYVWGYLTDLVYLIKPTCIRDLEMKIFEAVDNITAGTLTNVQSNFMKRMRKCLEENGYIVEHLL